MLRHDPVDPVLSQLARTGVVEVQRITFARSSPVFNSTHVCELWYKQHFFVAPIFIYAQGQRVSSMHHIPCEHCCLHPQVFKFVRSLTVQHTLKLTEIHVGRFRFFLEAFLVKQQNKMQSRSTQF